MASPIKDPKTPDWDYANNCPLVSKTEEELKAHMAPKKGEKFDDGKLRLGLNDDYFPRAQMAVAAVSMYGLRKYATSNSTGSGWQFVEDAMRRYGDDALRRHTLLQKIEGHYDEGDSGLAHKAQRAWNALADLELALQQGEIELSFGNDIDMSSGKPKPILGTAKKLSLKK